MLPFSYPLPHHHPTSFVVTTLVDSILTSLFPNTTAILASSVKPSYLDSTVASMASRADGKIKKKDEKMEETVEEIRYPYFDPEEPYTGDQVMFLDF